MCGVFGVFNVPNAAEVIAFGLHGLQHRGGDGVGIVTNDDKQHSTIKSAGSVASTFLDRPILLEEMTGTQGIGHTRYATAPNSNGSENLQPIGFQVDDAFVAMAHNGNFPNFLDVKKEHLTGVPFTTQADTEPFFRLILRETRNEFTLHSIGKVLSLMKGSCSAVMSRPDRLIAMRDPSGNRPLYWGKKGNGYVVASEPCSLEAVNVFQYEEVPAGSIMSFSKSGIESVRLPSTFLRMCTFELVYFAFPTSVIFGVNVSDFRISLGKALAAECEIDVDLIAGVPNSAVEIGKGFSFARRGRDADNILYRRHDARSFIKPGKAAMINAVNRKLAFASHKMRGKRILLCDDSIVRGNTSRRLVRACRDSGASEVHIVSGSPPIIDACVYGMNMRNRDLIAIGRSPEEIAQEIGADSVTYLSMHHFRKTLSEHGFMPENGCYSCMTGERWH